MSTTPVTAIVLAAGQGKRMKSPLPKVLHTVLGQPMLNCVLDALASAGIERPVVVVGHGGEQVAAVVGERGAIAWQREQLGTGHAAQCALPELESFQGDVIITCGDTPLIKGDTYARMIAERRRLGAAAVVATTVLEDARSYGRIRRDASGKVTGIVEFKDASPAERAIREINTGTYCFEAQALSRSLKGLSNSNAQKEYYLTDTLANLVAEGSIIDSVIFSDINEFHGVNDPSDLAIAEASLSQAVKMRILKEGVVLESPETIRIEPTVQIGPRTRIRPGVILEGRTVIGSDCVVGPWVSIKDARLEDGSILEPHGLRSR